MAEGQSAAVLNDHGFTLMEIIAVLVILSILGVVAVPKYFDLQIKARERAMETAMAEAVGRVNGQFAKELLDNVPIADIDFNVGTDTDYEDMGDFQLRIIDGEEGTPPADGCTALVNGCLELIIRAKEGTAAFDEDPSLTKFIPRPRGF